VSVYGVRPSSPAGRRGEMVGLPWEIARRKLPRFPAARRERRHNTRLRGSPTCLRTATAWVKGVVAWPPSQLGPWSARTTRAQQQQQRRCSECRAARWRVSFPRWWVQVPSRRRPRRLADGMEGQLATHTADWNAFLVSCSMSGCGKAQPGGWRGGRIARLLPAGREGPRWPGPCQGQGNKQHRVPALPKRHGWNGWNAQEVVPFLGDVGAFADPVTRAAMVAGGGGVVHWLQKTPKTFGQLFQTSSFFGEGPSAVYFRKAGERAQAPCRWGQFGNGKGGVLWLHTLGRGSAVPARGPKPTNVWGSCEWSCALPRFGFHA
jgi:hypothetical protein